MSRFSAYEPSLDQAGHTAGPKSELVHVSLALVARPTSLFNRNL